MEHVETSIETSSTTESGLFSDFGLSALSNLTQLARLTQNNTGASNTDSQSGTGMFNNVSASNSKNNNILSSSISSSNSKSANTAKATTITIAPKQANSSTTALNNPVVITLGQLKQATTVSALVSRPTLLFLAAHYEGIPKTTRASRKRPGLPDLWASVFDDVESQAAHRKTLRYSSTERRCQEKIRRNEVRRIK